MAKRKIDFKKAAFRIGLIIFFVILIFILVGSLFKKSVIKQGSINEGALKYKDKTCIVYYPNNKEFRKYAEDICSNTIDEQVYDYSLIPYGDYYLVSYLDGTKFFMDKNNNPLIIDTLSNECRGVVSDYLRYQVQSEETDEGYTIDFLEKSYYKNLNLENKKVTINGLDVSVYLDEFDRTVSFPIFAIEKYLNINLGSSDYKYVRPHYVSKTRKNCILTFDDGPSIKNSSRIIDELYHYGGSATFFILGNRMNQEAVDMIDDSISKGNVYGSHTENNKNLTNIESDEEILYEIMSPAYALASGVEDEEYAIKGINYNMQFYRPPFGFRNSRVDEISPLIAVKWDIDLEDWKYRDSEHLYNRLMELDQNDEINNNLISIHDCYDDSADGICKAIKELADKGYQFITVSEYFDLIDFDYNREYY